MREELLDVIRNSYVNMKKRQKKNQEVIDRVKCLEKNEFVREYLDLKLKIDKVYSSEMSDDEVIDVSIQGISSYVDNTNEIYVCLGEYYLSYKKEKYKRYMNIENENDFYLIAYDECEEFEKNHHVILLDYVGNDIFDILNKYREIQMDFFKTAIKENQEKACRKVLTKKY